MLESFICFLDHLRLMLYSADGPSIRPKVFFAASAALIAKFLTSSAASAKAARVSSALAASALWKRMFR
jgi:hypothetical protein